MHRALNTISDHLVNCHLNRRKDGTTYSAILAIGPVMGNKGPRKVRKPIAFVAVHTDVSKLKKLERALSQANIRLKKMTILDALTGIYNRRHFNDSIAKEWSDATRNKISIAAIMIDVDHFKKYNDFYGHQKKDQCLKKLALAIKKSLQRPQDMAARYGGEEFIALLPNTSYEGAIKIANTIMQEIKKLKIPHQKSETSKIVSISMGVVVQTPRQGKIWEPFIEQADKLLYVSKKKGRDQFTIKNVK